LISFLRFANLPQNKIRALDTRPMEFTLSLLRQLKYVESIFFADRDPHSDNFSPDPNELSHTDAEMVLLDLL
jgi:hypothetical protein